MNYVCAKCKKNIDDYRINLYLRTNVFRKKLDDTEEEINVSDIFNNESLCLDCFEDFVHCVQNFSNSNKEVMSNV